MPNKDRIEWLDAAKGIAIILMVVGHSSLPQMLSDFIWAFHMPFFFLASGWTTNWGKYSFREFLIRRLKSLLVPFLIYSIIVLIILFCLGKIEITEWIKNGWGGYALWFVPVLFVASLVSHYFFNILVNKEAYFVIVLAATGAILSYFHIHLPWNMSAVPYATALILLGTLLSRNVKPERFVKWTIVGVCITIVISHFWRLDIASNQITPIILLTVGALAGSFVISSCAIVCRKRCNIAHFVLRSIGKETLIILCFSQVVIILLKAFTDWGALIRYSCLIVVLLILKYLKDAVNNLIGYQFLR